MCIRDRELPSVFIKVCLTGGSALLLYANASLFTWIVASENVPQKIMNLLLSISSNKIIILLLIDVLLIAIGTIIDTSPAIIIFMPILLPIATSLGLNPTHFGLIMAMGLSIGLATPPVGTCLFIASNIANIPIDETISALLPYILVMFIVLILVTFIPELSLYIPKRVYW